MESYLKENFSDVKPKNSSEEALQRWRKLCWLVKNRKRRFRFTANLSRRFEVRAIQRSNKVWTCFASFFNMCLFIYSLNFLFQFAFENIFSTLLTF